MMKTKGSIALFRYWNRLRGGRDAPERGEIEPSDIKTVLPETFILEEADDEARFRLAGTRICAAFGRELRGAAVTELFSHSDRRLALRIAHGVFNRQAPALLHLTGESRAGRDAPFEMLVLPLGGRRADCRAIGVLGGAPAPAWLGSDPLARFRLDAVDLIDPDSQTLETELRRAERRAEIAPPSLAPGDLSVQAIDPVSGAVRRGHLLVLEGGRGR